MHHVAPIFRSMTTIVWGVMLAWAGLTSSAFAGNGTLTLKLEDETSGEPVISRVEFFRGAAPQPTRSRRRQRGPISMPIRQTVDTGLGVVVDRQIDLELPDGPYQFTITRGPEYRIIQGNFELEKTSLDEKTVRLPRMVDMAKQGWLSGDCCVAASSSSLPLRMASEDLHVAAVLGQRVAKPVAHRDADTPWHHEPIWIRNDAIADNGLVYYGLPDTAGDELESDPDEISLDRLVARGKDKDAPIRIGIENPFAWELPVWLASGQVDGLFVLGDWLRLDKRVLKTSDGRMPDAFSFGEATQLGRHAEMIYRHALNCGIPLVPLAGGGDGSAKTPVGYNRLYVAAGNEGAEQWWDNVWQGRSVATNGPLLRPLLADQIPGHTFSGRHGEELRLQPTLELAVRDPVEYLEVIHNNRVHYSARLDEFAAAGGEIPPIMAKSSGWVVIRVMTLHEEHYRAAISAPWWIEFDGQRHVDPVSVQFFRDWLTDFEKRLTRLPAPELKRYVPYVRATRKFWSDLADR